jgi:hypothetical protein
MRKLNFFIMAGLFVFAGAAQSQEMDLIQKHIDDAQFGEVLEPAQLKGSYIGTCYNQNGRTTTEALYWDTFTNAQGQKVDLGLSTLQTYDGADLPNELASLLQPTAQTWQFITDFVHNGLSGTDNNQGFIGAGRDFQYNYTSQAQEKAITVSVDSFRSCTQGGICNPPVLQGCYYGLSAAGLRVYQECVRQNDKTIFKKESDSTLISHRSADAIGQRINNLSFYLPAISTYCRWHNVKSFAAIKPSSESQTCRSCGPQSYPGCQICE